MVFPGEEDFGMTPLEMKAAGRPVIAFRAGGAMETVVEGETGLFFDEQTPASLVSAIEQFETLKWDRSRLRRHAEKFGAPVFASRIREFISDTLPTVDAKRLLETGADPSFSRAARIA